MTRYDLDSIASAVAAELRRSGGSRVSRPMSRGPLRRHNPASIASEIAAAILALPNSGSGAKPSDRFSQTVSTIASEVVARLAPAQAREDLPMERIEI